MKKTVICVVLGFVLLTGGLFAKSDLSINLGFQDGFMYGVSNYNLFGRNPVFSLGFMEEVTSSINSSTETAEIMLGFAMGFNVRNIVQFNLAIGPFVGVNQAFSVVGPGPMGELQIKFIPAKLFSPIIGVRYGMIFNIFADSSAFSTLSVFSGYLGFCINFR